MRALKRSFSRKIPYVRLYEPVLPGRYTVSMRLGADNEKQEAEFDMRPGSTYSDLLNLCTGFCEGYGEEDAIIEETSYQPVTGDALREGIVIKKDATDSFEQGNVYLTPEQVKTIIGAAGKAAYGHRISIAY